MLPVLASAQTSGLYDTWRWVRFGTESGLPSSKILDVFESGNGEVWAKTEGGLARFDGFQWVPAAVTWIDPIEYEALFVSPDTAGMLFLHQYELFSVRGDSVTRIPVVDREGALIPTVMALRERQGTLLLQGDTAFYRMSDSGISTIPLPRTEGKSVASVRDRSVDHFLHTDANLWLRVGPSLYKYAADRWEVVYTSPAGFLRVLHLAENPSGAGMAVLESGTGNITIFDWHSRGRLRELPGEKGDLIQSLAAGPEGQFLLLYASGELRIRQHGTWSWLPALPPSVEKPRFLKFLSSGDLWVGGENDLFLCRLSLERWANWKEHTPSLSNVVSEIVRARDGTFWIGTHDGVQVRSPDGTVRSIRELFGVRLGRITAIGEDPAGRIWIGSGASFSGAFCWDGRSWSRVGAEAGLNAPHVHRIARDRRGRLWFLGLGSGSLRRGLTGEPGAFVLEGGRFTRWGKAEGLLDGRVYSFVEDSRGGYWFGTWSGLSRFRDGQWTYWRAGKGLAESRMWTLAVDSSDRVFFSHQYRGLGYIDRGDSVRYLVCEERLVDYPIYEVQVDDRQWLWVATMNGLVCWNGTEWIRFDSRSGLPNDRLWPVLPLEREILVGTQGDGVAILRLDRLNPTPPIIQFADPLIDGDAATVSWRPLAYWGDEPSDLITTRFRLSGGPWSVWSTQHTITLRNLPPGDYRLDVQPKMPFDQGGTISASLTFTILPSLFFRPAVIIPLALLLSLAVLMAVVAWARYRSYHRMIRENEARLRAQYKAIPVPTATFKKGPDDFILADYNDAADAITQGLVRTWLGKPAAEIFPDRPPRKGLLHACYESKSIIRGEYRLVHQRLQRPIDVDLTLAFVPPDLVLVHAEDVTERKRNEQRLQESREQLRALATRLQSVREEERTALSREIHDELGQLITGLKMDLAWLRRRVLELGKGIPDVMSRRMAQMNGILDDAIHTVRKIAGELRPAVLDDLGLVAAVEWQAREFGERTGIRCETALGMDELPLDRGWATELFRIYQELLTNIARHAHATEVQITLTLDDGVLALEVRDNGRGIRAEDIQQPMSLGILGMEERTRRMRGTLSIAPGSRGGTIARVEVPLNGGDRR